MMKEAAERMYCIVMPLADKNLFVSLKQERWAGRVMEEVRHVFKQLVSAVDHMHQKGILHGDIKPLNIVRMDGRWLLIDLDAACEIGKQPVGSKSSSAYLCPEALLIGKVAAEVIVRSEANRKRFGADFRSSVGASIIRHMVSRLRALPNVPPGCYTALPRRQR